MQIIEKPKLQPISLLAVFILVYKRIYTSINTAIDGTRQGVSPMQQAAHWAFR